MYVYMYIYIYLYISIYIYIYIYIYISVYICISYDWLGHLGSSGSSVTVTCVCSPGAKLTTEGNARALATCSGT